MKEYTKYAVDKAVELLAIDSPTGYTKEAAQWTKSAFEELGFEAKFTNKGGVIVDLGGTDTENALLLYAHVDTLGGLINEIKGSGRLKIVPLGGLKTENTETETVRVHTRDGKVIEGTYQLCNASTHVNTNYSSTARNFNTLEVVLDEDVRCAEDVTALGIETGC